MASPPDIEGLYDAHGAALYGFLLNLTRDEAETRDLVQEVFLRIARRPAILDGVLEVRPFLLRLARNLAVDRMRERQARGQRDLRFAADQPQLFEAQGGTDVGICRSTLSEALGELPADQRAVVHLKLWEGLTFEQIGTLLEIPINTAASRYRYGLDKLRARLRPVYEELNGSV